MKPNKSKNIYKDIKDVFAKLNLPIKKDRKRGDFFVDISFLDDGKLIRCVGAYVDKYQEYVALTMSIKQTVPSDKIPVMLELINLVNQSAVIDHLVMESTTKTVILTKGVIIDEGLLDKKEFETAVRTILGNGSMFFPLVLEQISSNDKPEALMERFWRNNPHLRASCHLDK